MANTNTEGPINLVQITDIHLYANDGGTLLHMDTRNSLDHVIELVKRQESDIDLVLVTGDIAQEASEGAYRKFLKLISGFDAPIRWIPGNHDDPDIMQRVAAGTAACEKTIKINNWLILMLDTSILGQIQGRLSDAELDFLRISLREAAGDSTIEHCLVCIHHNPVPGAAGWMQGVGLHNADDFFEILETSEEANTLLYGHIHQDLDFVHRGIRCLCSPSTCIQFKSNAANFALDKVNPGYRSLRLFEDGRIETEVIRVPGDALNADYDSPGY